MRRFRFIFGLGSALIIPLIVVTALCFSACTPPPDPSTVDPKILGPQVFRDRCLQCHGATGQGLAGLYPPLATSPIVQGDKQHLIRILLHGLEGPVEINGRLFNNQMPSWGSLHDAEIAAVLSYVRTQWGNKGEAISMSDVTQMRAHDADRKRAWTLEQLKYEKPVELK